MKNLRALAATFAGILALPITIGHAQEAKTDEPATEASAEAPAALAKTPSVEGTKVYLVGLKEGKEVSSEFTVRFGLKGMGVAPAGIAFPETGHHHLLIDVDLENMDAPIPMDDNHRHFGKGQTEATLTLEPGEHTLQLVFADHNHIPHDPPVLSKKVTITVLAE